MKMQETSNFGNPSWSHPVSADHTPAMVEQGMHFKLRVVSRKNLFGLTRLDCRRQDSVIAMGQHTIAVCDMYYNMWSTLIQISDTRYVHCLLSVFLSRRHRFCINWTEPINLVV